jgi:hypothetical protein
MTARQMGWTSIKNGELLALASREFDVFVTGRPQSFIRAGFGHAADCGNRAQRAN